MTATTIKKRSTNPIADLNWVKRSTPPPVPKRLKTRRLTVVDLFCSCGGLSLGVWEAARLYKRKFDVRLAVDTNAKALEVFRKNLQPDPKVSRCDDVARLFDRDEREYLSSVERYWKGKVGAVDLLVAGPPCQGHSDLNNSTRRNDPRNGLYLRVARATEVLEPQVVIVENVPAVKHDVGRVVEKTESWLRSLDYGVSASTMHFSEYGVPQNRKRHILLGVKNGDFDLNCLETIESARTVGDFLSGLEKASDPNVMMFRPSQITERNRERINYLFDNDLYDLPDAERPRCHRDKAHAYVSMYGRMHWDKPAQTVTSGFGSMGQGRYVHPKERRLLTPQEAARLQGIPDFFDFSSVDTMSELREMIANAVPPQFTARLVSKLIEQQLL